MKRSLLATGLAAGLALLTVGCQGTGRSLNDHWNTHSIAPRVSRYFLGYDAERDGDYRDFAWGRKQDINLTLRRHLFNHNPDNPNHPEVPERFAGRPRNSLLPDPISFIHLEGMILGTIPLATGGVFIPLPIDSLIGVLEPGGRDEFMEGIEDFAGQTLGAVTSTFAHNWLAPMPEEEEAEPEAVTSFHRIAD